MEILFISMFFGILLIMTLFKYIKYKNSGSTDSFSDYCATNRTFKGKGSYSSSDNWDSSDGGD
jgi:hypothetical protein